MRTAPDIFKAYDIRAIIPGQLDVAGAEQVGRAFAALVKPKQVVVGRDMRTSGPQLHPALLAGLTKSGVDVIDIGLVSTDEYYYACATRQLPGLMITASHNPPEYNGFKMVRNMPFFVSGTELMPWVIDKKYPDAKQPGSVTKAAIYDEFLDYLLGVVETASFKPLKVVIDSGNGMTGPIWERLEPRLSNLNLIRQFTDLDGTFPNRGPDPLQSQNQAKIRDRVTAEKADLGFIFDTDGDRFFVVDDRGQSVPGDYIVALLAMQDLTRHPGSSVVYDVRASDVVLDSITKAGGKPVISKVGHANIKPLMQKADALFGGEISGHLYYKDFFFADSGLLPALKMLEFMSRQIKKLSEVLIPLEAKYFISGEINSTVADSGAVLDRLKKRYADAELDNLDGISIRYPDWHCNVRTSNTEPLVRLNLEADSEAKMKAKRDEVLALITA